MRRPLAAGLGLTWGGVLAIVTVVPAVNVGAILVRAMHRWFTYWERRVPSIYRVVAVGSGSLATAAGLGVITRTPWWRHLPLSVACWALLGKIEGDDPRAFERRL